MRSTRLGRFAAFIRLRCNRGGDRGAIAVVVSLVLGSGTLLGVGAVVVDVGQLYVEREELQSGADAAALAVGRVCALNPSSCASAASSTAQWYANANAKDGTSTLMAVCGRATGLAACPTPTGGGLSSCIGSAPTVAGYVEVRLATRQQDGSTLLPPTFAGAVSSSEYQGTQVTACARVAWGSLATSDVYALTISTCEWNAATGNGSNLQPQPPTLPPASGESVIYLHGNAPTCAAGSSGWDAPGGFGWLDGRANCTTTITAGGSYGGDSGNGVSWGCFNAMAAHRSSRNTVLIPIYDGVRGNGQNVVYHTVALAAFVITGYNITGAWSSSWLSGRSYCSGTTKCVYGYFTGKYVVGTPNLSGANYGVVAVQAVG